MSTVLILTPVIIGSWPAISAAVGAAAAAMGLAARESARNTVVAATEEKVETHIEVELQESQALADVVTSAREIVLTRNDVELRVRRNEQGSCLVCVKGRRQSEEELRAFADEFIQKMSQCFVYNRVMSELRARGFQVINEEQMSDESVRIHVRRWEG